MKKAIVIGATSGMGKGIARLLTENNFKVGVTGRRTELLNELKNEKNNSYFIKTFDITDTLNVVEKLESCLYYQAMGTYCFSFEEDTKNYL